MDSKKSMFILLGILVAFIASIYLFQYSTEKDNDKFKIYFFNAGKADCILISNNNKYIMIDTGEEELSSEILAYLKSNNIEKLDYLIITHFDKDHVGSAANVINNVEIANVLQSNCPKESTYYDNYITALEKNGITAQTISGDIAFELEDLKIEVNGPEAIYDNNESNNSSLIVSVNYKDTSYLFMGDAQNDRIKDYLSLKNEKYDFIKVPYHGNFQKQLDNLLQQVEPSYAVITCSAEEPVIDETVQLLDEMGIRYYLTKNGSVTILSDGSNIVIKQ